MLRLVAQHELQRDEAGEKPGSVIGAVTTMEPVRVMMRAIAAAVTFWLAFMVAFPLFRLRDALRHQYCGSAADQTV